MSVSFPPRAKKMSLSSPPMTVLAVASPRKSSWKLSDGLLSIVSSKISKLVNVPLANGNVLFAGV
jgi:hypothetical protein